MLFVGSGTGSNNIRCLHSLQGKYM